MSLKHSDPLSKCMPHTISMYAPHCLFSWRLTRVVFLR